MKKIATLIFFFCCAIANAQDANFSQFFASPITLNPALTGKFEGDFRVAGNYRNQWPAINNAYTTYTASFDMGILKNHIPQNDLFGVGLMAFSDKAGDGGPVVSNYAGLSTAYHKALDENGFHQIGAGFQGTFVSKRIDVYKLKFADQLTPLGFTNPTAEVFSNKNSVNVKYFDLNAGIMYNGSTNGENNFYLGASMYHITRPKETFLGGNYVLNPRVTFMAGGKIPIAGGQHAIHIAGNYSYQAEATNKLIGAAFELGMNKNSDNPISFYIGSWYRFGDAIIPYLGLEFGNIRVGYTYDINTSGLKAASNMRGGTEFSLIYIYHHPDPNARKLQCPKF